MRLWRISNYADLKGIGGLRGPGRWHNKGIPVVYLAESPALAMLEVLVHFEMDTSEVPDSYQLLEIEIDDDNGVSQLAVEHMPSDWRERVDYTRSVGDEWLGGLDGVLLRVPSVITPHSWNYLFNPRHELAVQASIVSVAQHPFDPRLTL